EKKQIPQAAIRAKKSRYRRHMAQYHATSRKCTTSRFFNYRGKKCIQNFQRNQSIRNNITGVITSAIHRPISEFEYQHSLQLTHQRSKSSAHRGMEIGNKNLVLSTKPKRFERICKSIGYLYQL